MEFDKTRYKDRIVEGNNKRLMYLLLTGNWSLDPEVKHGIFVWSTNGRFQAKYPLNWDWYIETKEDVFSIGRKK
jgi:hypothetical protein